MGEASFSNGREDAVAPSTGGGIVAPYTQEPGMRSAPGLGGLVLFVLMAVVTLYGVTQGVMNVLGWVELVVFVLLALGCASVLFAQRSSGGSSPSRGR